jgi:hypothetical protein
MASDWQTARDEGARLIGENKLEEAIGTLEAAAGDDPQGEVHALLGVTHFRKEEHGRAAEYYRAAIDRNAQQQDWPKMLVAAVSNANAEINVPVPDQVFFDADKLLAAPQVAEGALPGPPPALPPVGLLARLHRSSGKMLGEVASFAMGTATQLWGTLFGYRDRIWTNWYRRKSTSGVLTLAYMRDRLNKLNLKTTYPADALIGFQATGQKPPIGVSHYRTADGSWNNLADPKEGAAGTRFPRNVSNSAIEPETGDKLMTPNPREISRKLLTRHEAMEPVPFLNMLAACWIQFENHDWVNHGENEPKLHSIPLAEDDPFRIRYHQTHINIGKTQHDPTYKSGQDKTPITFINEVTHWWDGSQIYGSDQATVDRLRSQVDGKLKLQEDGRLPIGKNGVEDSGFVRNWWVGLSLLHTLFAKEHNAICDRLKTRYPQWDDNRLFNVARLINAAVMAKIHTVEWTPAILPNQVLSTGLHSNWFGLLTNLLRNDRHRKTVAQINIRNPELGGVVGNMLDKHGSAYGLTQEFVEIYRLHSLLPETLLLRRLSDDQHSEEIPLIATRQAGSPKLTDKYCVPDLMFSFGVMEPGQLVLNNYPAFMQEMSIPGNPLFDLGAVDILRARERGVPRYNEFRRQLGLNPIGRFEDLTDDPTQVKLLKDVYGDQPGDVENLDLMIGTLGEGHRPTGFGFGETMFQIFILNATRRLQADRFFTTCYNEETYTKEGLEWIDDVDFRTVLLRNYPELAETGLANIKNAFEPWDTSATLDPDRHPLREFDKDLQPNPWTGDRYR